MNILRAINKQFPSDAAFVLKSFFPALARILGGPKTIEHKTVLVFLKELLSREPELRLEPELVSELQPLVAQKSVAGKGFIKTLARELLEGMSQRCNLEAMLYSLLLSSGNRNSVIAEQAMKFFVRTLRRARAPGLPAPAQALQSFSKDLFFLLFEGLLRNLRAKRVKLVQPSEAALLFFLNALGREKFVFIVELMITEGRVPGEVKDSVARGISNAQNRVQAREQKKLKKQANSRCKTTFREQRNVSASLLSQGTPLGHSR